MEYRGKQIWMHRSQRAGYMYECYVELKYETRRGYTNDSEIWDYLHDNNEGWAYSKAEREKHQWAKRACYNCAIAGKESIKNL